MHSSTAAADFDHLLADLFTCTKYHCFVMVNTILFHGGGEQQACAMLKEHRRQSQSVHP